MKRTRLQSIDGSNCSKHFSQFLLFWLLTLAPVAGCSQEDPGGVYPSNAEGAHRGGWGRPCRRHQPGEGRPGPSLRHTTPVLMKRTREAVLFIENGLSLELWADEVVNGSGNSRIFRGTPGRIIASNGISALEIPSVITRELGDIHPQGNPHVWLDPLLAKVEAGNICEALKSADPVRCRLLRCAQS